MTVQPAPVSRPRRTGTTPRWRLATACVATLGVTLTGALAGPAVATAQDGAEGRGSTAAHQDGQHPDHSHGDGPGRGNDLSSSPAENRSQSASQRRQARKAAQRTAEDRALLMASTWEPDASLLEPQEGDSPATAALRASLAEGVDRLQASVRRHERTVERSDRTRARLLAARDDLVEAIIATAAARRQVEKDRSALMALMADTYRNGSVGSLSLVLGGSGEDAADPDRYSGEALFSGLTLLSQMSSSQDDALRKVRASARELARVQDSEQEARDLAAERDEAAEAALAEAEEQRVAVLAEVEGLQELVRESELRDEVERQRAAAREAARAAAEEAQAAREEDRALLSTFSGLVAEPETESGLLGAAARLASVSPGGVVFPLPPDAAWLDNDNWGGTGQQWSAGHTGNDFSAACGMPVLAATRGTVSVRTDQGWAGPRLVVVTGDDGVASTWYAHMSEVLVGDGDRVRAGQPIGAVGTEGNSTGCHLHFEVHPLGGSIYEDNVDPHEFLRLTGAYPGA